tara:strand:- start:227 stop:580 length:354 start_codon:yes stop_codon:yes gene_type:complete
MINLVLLSLILGGYSLFLIKTINKKTNMYLDTLKSKLDDLKFKSHEKNIFLLDELDNKIKSNEELLLGELKNINNMNQKDNNIKHQQLISNEFKKLRLDVNKDLNDIVEIVKNPKIF